MLLLLSSAVGMSDDPFNYTFALSCFSSVSHDKAKEGRCELWRAFMTASDFQLVDWVLGLGEQHWSNFISLSSDPTINADALQSSGIVLKKDCKLIITNRYLQTNICTFDYLIIYLYVCLYVYLFIVFMYVYMSICMYVYIYVCMCMYVCI